MYGGIYTSIINYIYIDVCIHMKFIYKYIFRIFKYIICINYILYLFYYILFKYLYIFIFYMIYIL